MAYHCEIVLDSISRVGCRLTTIKVRYPLLVHNEFLRHRCFSRSVSSNRSIPTKKIIEMVEEDPFIPIYWGKNQKGMQADEELSDTKIEEAKKLWLSSLNNAVNYARKLSDPNSLNLHKQIANRVLAPYQWVTEVITGTDWTNFFNLRCHKDAMPEIMKIALMIEEEYGENQPEWVEYNGWHLPFMMDDEAHLSEEEKIKVSAARCARTSYVSNTTGRASTVEEDLKLYDRLMAGEPKHSSPLEHVAYALAEPKYVANFRGWHQYRKVVDPD